MNKTIAALCGAVAFVSSAATAAPTDAMTDCKTGSGAWNDAFNKHDAEALANMYDAKTGMFSTDYWTATGHDALLAGFKQMVAAGMTETSVTCEHAVRQGDVNVADGTYVLTGKAPNGKDVNVTGHFIVVATPGKDGVILTHFSNEQRQPPPK
jgi:ketosteroid isomerase-like protein